MSNSFLRSYLLIGVEVEKGLKRIVNLVPLSALEYTALKCGP